MRRRGITKGDRANSQAAPTRSSPPVRRRRPEEAPPFQPLCEQAHPLPVMPEHLDQSAAPATEHEQMPTMRVAPERLLHLERQAIKALALMWCTT
jgi:hypothetical protein